MLEMRVSAIFLLPALLRSRLIRGDQSADCSLQLPLSDTLLSFEQWALRQQRSGGSGGSIASTYLHADGAMSGCSRTAALTTNEMRT
jgi:hypothetical protein